MNAPQSEPPTFLSFQSYPCIVQKDAGDPQGITDIPTALTTRWPV